MSGRNSVRSNTLNEQIDRETKSVGEANAYDLVFKLSKAINSGFTQPNKLGHEILAKVLSVELSN